MNYGWHSPGSGLSCFADSRGFRGIHHKNTTASCFSLHPFFFIFWPASRQDTALARPLRDFSFSVPISWSGGCGLVLGQPGWHQGQWPGALAAPWLWQGCACEGQGRTRGTPGTLPKCPGDANPVPKPPTIPSWALRIREFAFMHVSIIYLYMLRLPLATFHPLTLHSNPPGRKGSSGVVLGLLCPHRGLRLGGPWCSHPFPVSFPRAPLSSQGEAGQLGKAHFSSLCSTAR